MRVFAFARTGAIAAIAALLLASPAAAFAAGTTSTPTDTVNGSAHAAVAPGTVTAHAVTAQVAVPSGYPVNGIDVSSHDHADGATIDWPARYAAGEEFTFIKATEGTSYVNSYFAGDFNAAKSAGLYVGAYAFARPDLSNPVGQADFLVNNMHWSADGRTLPPFLDLEWPYASLGLSDCYGLSQSSMRSWISSFLTEVSARIGRTPMIYTNVNWWNSCTGSSTAFAGYPLDVSSCNATPPSVPGWGTNWTFWQYDIDACGRGAAHDADVFNGTVTQLAALAVAGVAVPARIGVVNGAASASVKEGSLDAGWVTEATGVAQVVLSGTRIGVLTTDGRVLVKDGGLGAAWVTEATGAAQVVLSGTRVGVRYSDGSVAVKDGDLGAAWTTVTTGAAALALSGTRVGVLFSDGHVAVKEGSLDAGWVTEATGVTQVVLSGTRVGVRYSDGSVAVKDGDLGAAWVAEATGAAQVVLSGTRVGVRYSDGSVAVKDGGLGAAWVAEATGAAQVVLSGTRVGVRYSDGSVAVKDGDLGAAWVTETTGATQLALSAA